MDQDKKMQELKSRLADIPPLEDEPGFFNSDETIARFLKSRDWNLNDAEKMIKESIEYRRKTRPLSLDCKWCHDHPGCHSMRQVGFDEGGRPVIYSNFAQATIRHNTTEDSICHCTYLIENAKRSMPAGVSTWVFVIDCTGMTIGACNPRLGYGVTQVMSNHYPERLGLVICVNHNPVFHGIWKAMKKFIHPNTSSKVKLIKSKSKVKQEFHNLFPTELANWLLEEMHLNKSHPLPITQKEFWNKPQDTVAHDPRGCPSYVKNHIDGKVTNGDYCTGDHKPHPNIIDSICGKLKTLTLSDSEHQKVSKLIQERESSTSSNSEEEEQFEQIEAIDIPEDLQVPEDAKTFS